MIVAAAMVAGAALGRWWALALPLLGLSVFAGAHVVLGPSWGADTPVVAIAVVGEGALAVGIVLRRRIARFA